MSFTSRLSAASCVPPAYIGLWKRSYIQRNQGSKTSIDQQTQAWWFQSPRLHIDLRIPSDRPKLTSAQSVTQLSTQEWGRFTAQTSFAGLTSVNAEQCEWHPEIAFPVLATEPDVGIIRFDAADCIMRQELTVVTKRSG